MNVDETKLIINAKTMLVIIIVATVSFIMGAILVIKTI